MAFQCLDYLVFHHLNNSLHMYFNSTSHKRFQIGLYITRSQRIDYSTYSSNSFHTFAVQRSIDQCNTSSLRLAAMYSSLSFGKLLYGRKPQAASRASINVM